MKASLCMLSAAVAVCVAHAAALAQYPGGPNTWPGGPGGVYRPPVGPVPPNWTAWPRAGGYRPPGSSGPAFQPPGMPGFPGGPNLNGPGLDPGFIGPGGLPRSFSPPAGILREPMVRDVLDRMQKGNPAAPRASPQIPPALLNPPKIDFSKFEPARLPVEAPGRHAPFAAPPGRRAPFAAPSWLRWEWAAGIFVLCLLAGLLHGYFARKQTGP